MRTGQPERGNIAVACESRRATQLQDPSVTPGVAIEKEMSTTVPRSHARLSARWYFYDSYGIALSAESARRWLGGLGPDPFSPAFPLLPSPPASHPTTVLSLQVHKRCSPTVTMWARSGSSGSACYTKYMVHATPPTSVHRRPRLAPHLSGPTWIGFGGATVRVV
ncbi:hypothetical protein NPX13_g2047 [Xylaria arbuscula]|uniref:Uncharacterized protein n=1 Tax=Xylaria arbuscula TaxID=114810 RepID=A0A9W8NKC7_9PEZI|nr:hypothetical protein NPX13_g2047 [Xylaria arbuscula]